MRRVDFSPVMQQPDEVFAVDEHNGELWHRVVHRVLYADTDRSEAVYHANYLRFYELGRASLMRSVGPSYREIEQSGFGYPIIDLRVSFHRALTYDDPIWIFTRPSQLERVRVTFSYRILHAETHELVNTGYTCHACVNERRTPAPVDPISLAVFKRFGVTLQP